jgi:hypothetical protein
MKSLIKASLLIFVVINLISCFPQRQRQFPISKLTPNNNVTYKVDYLFEHEGCKVYRFWDQGYYVYFTNCTGEVTSIKTDSTETRVINVIRNNPPK